MKKFFTLFFVFFLSCSVAFAALPTVLFNSGTGSDTAASGAGPGTALSGANAATVAANNVVTLAVDAPDLSGVATDGSAVIYVNSTSGRKFSKISTVDNVAKTVTCQDNFANTEGTRGWGVGGKRATLAASLTLGTDAYEGWTLQFEDDASLSISAAYVFAPTLSAADGMLKIQGDSASTRRVCTQSSNLANFSFATTAANFLIQNLHFKNSNATRTAANAYTGAINCQVISKNVIFGDPTNKLNAACTRTSASPNFTFYDDEFKNLITGTSTQTATVGAYYYSWAHDGAAAGFVTGTGQGTIIGCLSTNNATDAILVQNNTTVRTIAWNTTYGNVGDDLDTTGAAIVFTNAAVFNNNWGNSTGVGWNSRANTDSTIAFNDFNNYFSNSGGARINVSAGPHDTAVDPQFTATGSNDFSVGTNLKALGAPDSTRFIGANNSGTKSYINAGVAQRQESSSSGGGSFICAA